MGAPNYFGFSSGLTLCSVDFNSHSPFDEMWTDINSAAHFQSDYAVKSPQFEPKQATLAGPYSPGRPKPWQLLPETQGPTLPPHRTHATLLTPTWIGPIQRGNAQAQPKYCIYEQQIGGTSNIMLVSWIPIVLGLFEGGIAPCYNDRACVVGHIWNKRNTRNRHTVENV